MEHPYKLDNLYLKNNEFLNSSEISNSELSN